MFRVIGGKTVADMLEEDFNNRLPLNKFRTNLSKEDQTEFQNMLDQLKEEESALIAVGAISPLERLLLLINLNQHKRIECLEFFLQRQSKQNLSEFVGDKTAGRWNDGGFATQNKNPDLA